MKKIALVPLRDYLGEAGIPGFTNLHGWWIPPNYVMEFWVNGAKFQYRNENDYHGKRMKILEGHRIASQQFLKMYHKIKNMDRNAHKMMKALFK